jgi:hypothetical protein
MNQAWCCQHKEERLHFDGSGRAQRLQGDKYVYGQQQNYVLVSKRSIEGAMGP